MRKINHCVLTAILYLFSIATFATTHTIQVGVASGLTFTPNSITGVAIGDVIHWVWVSGTHSTVSQGIPSGAAAWDNAISASSTTFDYTITTAGTYNYQCGPHGSNMTGTFTVSGATGLVDKTTLVYATFELSPNPVSDVLSMKFNAEKSFKANLLVFDANGKEKMDKKIEVLNGENSYSFSFAHFPKGIYYLTLMDGNTSFISKKFVKE